MKNFSKEKIYGIAGTAVFHILLLLLLYLLVMEPVPPQPEKSNVEMQSAVENVAGEEFFEAKVVKDTPQQVPETPSSASSKVVKEPLIAQNSEPSIPVDSVNSKKNDKAKQPVKDEAEKKRVEEEKRKAADEAERKEKIAKSVAGSLKKSGQTSSSGGDTSGIGLSGTAVSGADNGGGKGSGSNGGPVYNVGNRSVVKELSRNIPVQEEGEVVVHVTVNPEGKVVKASARGTSVALKKVAEREAYKVVFNKVSSLDNEEGTITFRFRMNY